MYPIVPPRGGGDLLGISRIYFEDKCLLSQFVCHLHQPVTLFSEIMRDFFKKSG